VEVRSVLDATDFISEQTQQQVDRHDVAECVIETHRPIACDAIDQILHTGRFVVVDDYEIAGAGVILERLDDSDSTVADHVRGREFAWEAGSVTPAERATAYGHASKFVLLTGSDAGVLTTLAGSIEQALFKSGFKAYFARSANVARGLDADISFRGEMREEHVRRLGELARIMTDAGQIFVTSLPDADEYDLRTLELLNRPSEILVINVGENLFANYEVALNLAATVGASEGVERVCAMLKSRKVIMEYCI